MQETERNNFHKKRKTVQHKLFISFLLSIITPIIVFLFLISSYILINEKRKNEEELKYLSSTISFKIDDEIRQIDEYVLGLSVTSWMEKMMYSQQDLLDYSRFDPVEIRNYNQQLSVSATLNAFIKNMDVILNEKNLVFSQSESLSDINTYLKTTFDLKESEYNTIRSIISEYNDGLILYPTKRFQDENSYMLYIKTIPGKGDGLIRGTVVFTIDTDYMDNTICNTQNNENIRIVLSYQDKLVVGDYNLWYELTKDVGESFKDDETDKIKIDDVKYTFLSTQGSSELRTTILVDNKELLKNIYFVAVLILSFLLILIACSYLFARLVTKSNYRSLAMLLGIIQSPDLLDDTGDMEDEYSSILQHYKKILSLNKAHISQISQQQKEMVAYCWQVLLEKNHEIDAGILETLEEYAPLSYFNRHFCCVVMSKNHQGYSQNLSVFLNSHENTLTHIVNYFKYSCIIVHTSDEKIKDAILKEIGEYVNKSEEKELKCGVGLSCTDINDINKSYNEAMLMVNWQNGSVSGKVLFRRDYNQLMSNFYYTVAQETALGNLLRNGDYDGTVSAISEILDVNMSLHSISPKAIRNFFIAIYLTGIRIAGEFGLDIEQNQGPSELSLLHNMEEISSVVYEYMKALCDRINNETNTNKSFEDSVRSFVDENTSNPNISMQKVSDHIGHSLSFTSRLFNRIYKMSFVEYINRRRVDAASQLLKNSKLTIKEVAETIGFSSDISFRRSFQKYKGVSPGKYRKMI